MSDLVTFGGLFGVIEASDVRVKALLCVLCCVLCAVRCMVSRAVRYVVWRPYRVLPTCRAPPSTHGLMGKAVNDVNATSVQNQLQAEKTPPVRGNAVSVQTNSNRNSRDGIG